MMMTLPYRSGLVSVYCLPNWRPTILMSCWISLFAKQHLVGRGFRTFKSFPLRGIDPVLVSASHHGQAGNGHGRGRIPFRQNEGTLVTIGTSLPVERR